MANSLPRLLAPAIRRKPKRLALFEPSGNLAYIAGLDDDMLVLAAGQAFLAEKSVRYVVEEANN